MLGAEGRLDQLEQEPQSRVYQASGSSRGSLVIGKERAENQGHQKEGPLSRQRGQRETKRAVVRNTAKTPVCSLGCPL